MINFPHMKKDIPELAYLLEKVEKKYGRKPVTSSDYDDMSSSIETATGQHLSASTLKRMWGYVEPSPSPRQITLNILSIYVGYPSFQGFCEELRKSDVFSSLFFTAKTVLSESLKAGETVTIGWAPDRMVTLRYHGDTLFEVIDGGKSQLKKGDKFRKSEFILGKPMFIGKVIRGDAQLASYVAGKDGGLNLLKVSGE